MISKETQNAIDIFKNRLIVGNHDTITLFGTTPQNQLRNYAKTISRLFANTNDDLEIEIKSVILELERFEEDPIFKDSSFFGSFIRKKSLNAKYNSIMQYIERVSSYFQLQQAQLIKENKLLEKLSETLDSSADELQACIKDGEQILSQRNAVNLQTDENIDMWFLRLERRLDDLRVSHTIALQNKVQVKVLYNNNLIILDKLLSAVSNTFPIWQSQIVLLLGIEKAKNRLIEQDKVSSALSQHTKIDTERLLKLNEDLKSVLKETINLGENDCKIRKDFKDILNLM